jgi:hypothetical protein
LVDKLFPNGDHEEVHDVLDDVVDVVTDNRRDKTFGLLKPESLTTPKKTPEAIAAVISN